MTQMPSHGIEALTNFAIDAIGRAGKVAMDSYGKGGGTDKFDEGLVTRAELQSPNVLKRL